jgi:hypothetical protein
MLDYLESCVDVFRISGDLIFFLLAVVIFICLINCFFALLKGGFK